MNKPTFGSLFAGIGGIDLGLERAGWECRWQVEIDDYCRAVLTKHWPDVPKYGDVRELTGAELEPVNLIAGGFPCQPTSRVGQRRGAEDERWLWPQLARILRMVRPPLALVENPTGLLDGIMADVLADLAEMGFDAEWGVLPACVLGAPHTRERVFIVAHLDGSGRSDGARRAGPAWSARWRIAVAESIEHGIPAWSVEPAVGRVVDGVPGWMVGRLGNAVVPQVAEWVGRHILKAWKEAERVDALGAD